MEILTERKRTAGKLGVRGMMVGDPTVPVRLNPANPMLGSF
jgi:hypothetical protein